MLLGVVVQDQHSLALPLPLSSGHCPLLAGPALPSCGGQEGLGSLHLCDREQSRGGWGWAQRTQTVICTHSATDTSEGM